jgi:hypothetical protein
VLGTRVGATVGAKDGSPVLSDGVLVSVGPAVVSRVGTDVAGSVGVADGRVAPADDGAVVVVED